MRLEARGLDFGYPGKPVGRGVSLAVGPGEVLCLLGSNGAGKTTLFRTLLGLARFSHSAGGCPVGWWLGGRPLAWARLHGVVNGVVWTHGVIALFSAIGSGLGDLRFLGRDAQAAAFRSMA